jgi:hypothetical protein
MTPAQREAYARANTSLIHLPALEFRHPTFSVPLRLVDFDSDLSLPLEDFAPVDSAETVLFVGTRCEIRPPDIDDQVDSVTTFRIDGVSGLVQTLLANANKSNVPIDSTLRFYSYNLRTGLVDVPVGVIHQQVRNITITKTTISISIGYKNSANKRFPAQLYTSYSNPGLIA